MSSVQNILERLSPPELYIWTWLSELAHRQETLNPKIPTGPPPFYTRRHLRKILKSLENKRFLVIIAGGKNQCDNLHVGLASDGVLGVRPVTQDRAEAMPGPTGPGKAQNQPQNEAARSSRTGHEKPGKPLAALLSSCRPVTQDRADTQLSLASRYLKLEAWFELEQNDLLKRLCRLDGVGQEELLMRLASMAPVARAGSRTAKLYAAIRYIQERQGVKKPRAWVEALAKRTERQIRGGHGTAHDSRTLADHHPQAHKAGAQSF